MNICGKSVCQGILIASALASLISAELLVTVVQNKNEFRCLDAEKKFADCQFMSYPDGGVVDMSHKDSGWLKLDDSSSSSGVCEATFSDKFKIDVPYLIACRVRETSDGPWEVKEGVFIRNPDGRLDLNMLKPTPSNTSLTTKNSTLFASVKGGDCEFLIPGQEKRYIGNATGMSCSERIGTDVVQEVVIARVGPNTPEDTTPDPSDSSESKKDWFLMRIKPLTESKLTFLTEESLTPGDVLTASCEVPKNQEVIWKLDSEAIKEASCDADKWPWSFQNCVATLDHKVRWQDNGRRLGCFLENKMRSTSKDNATEILNVTFAPRMASMSLNWQAEKHLNISFEVAANPVSTVFWAMADGPLEIINQSSSGKYEIDMDLSNTTSKALVLSVTLENSIGSRSSQILIGQPSETTWLLILSGALGGLCLLLLIVVLVLVLLRKQGHKPGASQVSVRMERGRSKAVESGLYAEVGEEAEYDDIWYPQNDEGYLPPIQPTTTR